MKTIFLAMCAVLLAARAEEDVVSLVQHKTTGRCKDCVHRGSNLVKQEEGICDFTTQFCKNNKCQNKLDNGEKCDWARSCKSGICQLGATAFNFARCSDSCSNDCA